MKLYFFQQSRATRARWMLEELGIPYELAPVDMVKGRIGGWWLSSPW
jgi:glutathione S-transferase